MKRLAAFAVSALIAGFFLRPAVADPVPGGHESSHHAPAAHGVRPGWLEEGGGQPAERGHIFGPHWRQTLSEAQRVRIDELHLKLQARRQPLKAEIGLREAELNGMIANDMVDPSAVRVKIDEIIELRRRIMQARYDHMIEMRKLLSPEQRITFDLGLLGGHRQH